MMRGVAGEELAQELEDFAARGPLAVATHSFVATRQGDEEGGRDRTSSAVGGRVSRRRPVSTPRVATMYATM